MHPTTDILRMIDANLNRSREGIRVLEDTARFVLNDESITRSCKEARHQLRDSMKSLQIDHPQLIASRDTESDVGTTITTPHELDRSKGLQDIVIAASKRTTEALRVIEEVSKTINQSSSQIERTRYTIYTIEKQILEALTPACPQWTLCVLITQSMCRHHEPLELIKRISRGGADCIQIREKSMCDAELVDHASKLTACAHNHGLHVMINDRPDIAVLSKADGVHLGLDDLAVSQARTFLGPQKWIGRTCPTQADAIDAIKHGADTCGLGPIFPSSTKPKDTVHGLQRIQDYLADTTTAATPLLAISGIDQNNVQALAEIGCPGVAVSSAVCHAEDPESVCRSIIDTLSATIVAD